MNAGAQSANMKRETEYGVGFTMRWMIPDLTIREGISRDTHRRGTVTGTYPAVLWSEFTTTQSSLSIYLPRRKSDVDLTYALPHDTLQLLGGPCAAFLLTMP